MVALSEVSDEKSTARLNVEAPPRYRAVTTPVKKVSTLALSAARQAIEELGPATNRHKLLVRAEAIWATKKELNADDDPVGIL